MRRLIGAMVLLERSYIQKIRSNKDNLIGKLAHTDLFSIQPEPLCRGIAIGMFWAFIPMPLQMIPALLFCWIGFANLPIAIVCVWISNPFTYIPMFYVEYKIAAFFQEETLTFDEFRALWGGDDDDPIPHWSDWGEQFLDIYFLILEGGILLGVVAAIIGYFCGYPLARLLKKHGKFRKK